MDLPFWLSPFLYIPSPSQPMSNPIFPDDTTKVQTVYGTCFNANDFLVGSDPNIPIYVAMKGIVFDVSKNSAYHPGGSYRGK